MQNNCIKNLLNFKEVVIKNIKNLKDSVEVYAEFLISEQTCPCCSTKTSKIHDHYVQPIKDIPIHLKPTTIYLRKTRYECPSCGKSFYPSNEVIARYNRKSTRLVDYIVDQLRKNISASNIAKSLNIDSNFISKLLPYLSVSTSSLPRVLCIYEFKGNSGKYKYQVALLDGESHKVIDIIECNALDKIWIDVKSNLPKSERKYFKHSRGLLLSRRCKIKETKYDELEFMLNNYSEDLRIAYREKEDILDIIHSTESPENKKKLFSELVKRNLESPLSKFLIQMGLSKEQIIKLKP